MSTPDTTVHRGTLDTWARKLLARQGMFAAEAVLLIEQLHSAESLQASAWGWARLPQLIEAFANGAADPRARMTTQQIGPDHLRLAAGMGCGPVATLRAIPAATELARSGSTVLVEVVNSFAGLPPRIVQALFQQAGCGGAYATVVPGADGHPRPTQIVQLLVAAPPTAAGQLAAQTQLHHALREATGDWVTTNSHSEESPAALLSGPEEIIALSTATLVALQECGMSSRVPLVLDEVAAGPRL